MPLDQAEVSIALACCTAAYFKSIQGQCLISGSHEQCLPPHIPDRPVWQASASSQPPSISQSGIVMENYRDVWSWIKIIAVWFEENIYLKFITYMEITKKFIERHSIFRQWYFLVIWSNTCLLPQSQVCHCGRRLQGNMVSAWTQTPWTCCWLSYTNPLPRSNYCPPLPW